MDHRLSRPTVLQRGLFALGALLSVAIALVSYRYLVPGVLAPEGVAANGFVMPWLPMHATGTNQHAWFWRVGARVGRRDRASVASSEAP